MSKTTYTKITAKIILLTLLVTLITAFVYGEYMKKNAISSLSHEDAKKTSMLIFESLYSAMQKGWNKEDLREIITRLNRVDPSMKIDVYRSQAVSEIFGEIEKDKIEIAKNREIQRALRGEEVLNISSSNSIKYYYPVIAKQDCLKCHTNVKESDVLGVIDVMYPVENLKVSLDEMINFFIMFIIVFSFVIFFAIFIEFNQYILKPIKKFTSTIQNITKSHDMTQRVEVNDNIQEIDSIKDVFNIMLDSIEYQFYYDALTGLQNRRKLTEKLEEKKNAFLMIINIDSFQEINDLYGNEAGDEILKEFALFLKEHMFGTNALYRLHSDEFSYLCDKITDIEEFKKYAYVLNEKISQKLFKINGDNVEVSLSATMGISYGNQTLLENADIALKIAKKNKKDILVYDETMHISKEYEKNFEWTKRLKKAIEDDKVAPVFQPIVDNKTQKIVKYEALVRIVDNNGVYIAPIHFLELAKRNKLYHHLTKIMIEKTFEKFKDLPYCVSINISVDDILNKETNKFILDKLKETKIGKKIVFEIIESEGIENFEQVLEFITNIKNFGAKISIDDFGTGYSNFDYLMKLKVDYIKIDGSMIRTIDTDKNSQMVTKTIVNFAKSMNIKTVAEFVHSKNVFQKVKELEVDFSQGYYFGEPSENIF